MDSGKQGTGLENQRLGVQIRGGLKNWALHRDRKDRGGGRNNRQGGGVRKMREGVNNQGRLKARRRAG